MPKRPIKLRWRRQLRKSQIQVEEIGVYAEENLDKHLLRRFDHLWPVRRFVIGWVTLLILLIGAVIVQNIGLSNYYQVLSTVPGGIYSEGVVGSFTNANPIYATSDADNTVSHLIFAGLLKTDDQGKLVGNLAKSYSVDTSEKVYTIHLKPNLVWQDGKPLTAKDVVFTFNTIENPDAQSPLFSSWQGVSVTATDLTTVVFKLPSVLASFPYNLTTGILPAHILSSVSPSELRSDDFNTVRPIGAGPFSWHAINVQNGGDPLQEQVQIALKPFSKYVGGTPKLDQFVVQIYANQAKMFSAFENKDLSAMEAVNPPPANVQNKSGVISYNFLLRAADMVFFKTTSGILADKAVRQSLVEATNVPQIINHLGYPTVAVNEPLLREQLAYNQTYAEASYNLANAKIKLNNDGWILKSNGIRYKNSQQLSFNLIASDTSENRMVTDELKSQWRKLGVNLSVQLLVPSDFQNALSYHEYDAVLAGISIGEDPDVFVYWDSSQADIRSANRLNFSEYDNPIADESLESGRTRLDPSLRVIKYAPFLEAWQQDAPAVGLYQPRLLYLANTEVGGLNIHPITKATDRFSNVQNWEIREAKVTR